MEIAQVWRARTAIRSLPREKVQQSRQGLSDEHKTDPEDDITSRRSTHTFKVCQDVRQKDEWQLEDHSSESNPCLLLVNEVDLNEGDPKGPNHVPRTL